jgi:WD40 repeat protein
MADLSEYEQVRAQNIERNAEFLRSIGMDETQSDIRASAVANKTAKASSRGVSKRKALVQAVPARRSSRVTIERLKSEDFSLLSEEDRAAKQAELDKMLEAKASNAYETAVMTNAAYGNENDDRWTRLPSEPINALPPYNQPRYDDEEEKESKEYFNWGKSAITSLLDAVPSSGSTLNTTSTSGEYMKRMQSLQVADNDVAKVTENRITSVWVHPSTDRLLVAAGDKSGYFGLWDVDAPSRESKAKKAKTTYSYGDKYASLCGVDGVYKYRPHVGNLARIYSTPSAVSNIHTVSYDGTVRMLDLHHSVFIEKFCAKEGLEEMWYTDACEWMDASWNPYAPAALPTSTSKKGGSGKKMSSTPASNAGKPTSSNADNILFVSRSDGYVSMIDYRKASQSRNGNGYAWSHDTGYKVQSVQHWPTDENYILVANAGKGTDGGSASGVMSVLDIRMIGSSNSNAKQSKQSSVCEFYGHSKSINAAYASPDGQYVVSVSQDNTLRCWSSPIKGASSSNDSGFLSKKGSSASATSASPIFTHRIHDNHTGRWLSTFRPQWDPKSPHSFILGSMTKPRCVEIFDINTSGNSAAAHISSPYVLRSDALASVVSRNAVHPTMDIIACANSSGRVHIFR